MKLQLNAVQAEMDEKQRHFRIAHKDMEATCEALKKQFFGFLFLIHTHARTEEERASVDVGEVVVLGTIDALSKEYFYGNAFSTIKIHTQREIERDSEDEDAGM